LIPAFTQIDFTSARTPDKHKTGKMARNVGLNGSKARENSELTFRP